MVSCFYIKQRVRDLAKTVPCVIQLLTRRNSEYSPFMVTQCDLLLRKFSIHDKSS